MQTTIGRFQLNRELGRGAQSVVYLGFDPHLQREVVIKTLPRATRADSTRLLAEARTVSRLRHAHIVPIFDADEADNGVYLVFEYVPGSTLANKIAQGALPIGEAISIARKILAAVGHAHEQGIIHRDLKPSNILLAENGEPRVTDFGIAMRLGGSDAKTAQLSGTPAYMAPEYIKSGVAHYSNDLFAVGLLLYEMLTGRVMIKRGELWSLLHTRCNEAIRIPQDCAVDDRLANLVHRALALQASERFASVSEFAEALDAATSDAQDVPAAQGAGALEFLFRRMRHKSDFPALSSAVTSINRIVASDSESSKQLSDVILRDFALTNKVLRMVNSAAVGRLGGNAISTVSRAVIVLGFNAIRNMAVTFLLVENLQNKAHATRLREEFVRAMLSALLARGVAQKIGGCEGEEAFICGLFHNLGRMLTLFYFPEEAEEIRTQMELRNSNELQAATRVLGVSFEELGKATAETWGLPLSIVHSLSPLPEGKVKLSNRPAERLHIAASLADELSRVVCMTDQNQAAKQIKAVTARFQETTGIGEQALNKLLENAVTEVQNYSRTCNLDLSQTAIGKQLTRFHREGGTTALADYIELSATEMADTVVNLSHREVTEKIAATEPNAPSQAEQILSAGIQDISHALVEDLKLNDILRIILETMFRGMKFERVLLAVRDAKNNEMRGRFGFGPDISNFANSFRFVLDGAGDVFQLVLKEGVDLLITDANDAKIKTRIPAWFRQVCQAETFVLFPLTIKEKPLALIYADAAKSGAIVIPEKELNLLRTLRNQALLAIKQSM